MKEKYEKYENKQESMKQLHFVLQDKCYFTENKSWGKNTDFTFAKSARVF